jgi:hypothetical protein
LPIFADHAAGLAEFTAVNAAYKTTLLQTKYPMGWHAYLGEDGLKIADVIQDDLQSVVNHGTLTEPG